MSTAFELDKSGWQQRISDARMVNVDLNEQLDASAGEGIFSGIGQGVLRGGARTAEAGGIIAGGTLGRALDVASATGETLDALTFDDEGRQTSANAPIGTERQDSIFSATDEAASSAVQFWTPSSRDVGAIGRTLGGFAEMVLPLAATGGNPVPLIATSGIEGSKELIDQGVDATTAIASGEANALATAVGFKLPFLGKTLAGKVLTGGAGNVLLGGGATELQKELLTGRGYDEMAKNYDPLDVQSRAIDLLAGMAFGGIDWANVRSADRAAAAAANNAKHYQQDTAPGIPQDFNAIAAHAHAMDTALDQMIRGEPVSVDPAVASANFAERPAKDYSADEQAMREIIGDLPEPRVQTNEVVRPEATGDAAIRNPVDFEASPEVKLEQLKTLTAENLPVVQKLVDDLNSSLPGTKSKMSVKEDAKILSKAARPEILARKPWHGVEHIRDALRFKTVIDSVDQLPQVVDVLRRHGIETVKVDTRKLLEPEKWGWRIVALDLRMPNGQLVEHYMPLKELEAAKKAEGHQIFEEWRNRDPKKMTPNERAELLAAQKRSTAVYQAAWEAAAERTGLDDTAAAASLKSFSDSAESLTGTKSAVSPTVQPSGEPHLPSIRTAQKSGQSTSTTSPSRDLDTEKSVMGESSTGIIRAGSFESPVITELKEQLKQTDVMVATGELDAEGNAVVRSGREALAQAEADVAKAVHDSQAFEAAVTCFLTKGEYET